MSQPLVSVIIPTYNRAEFLREAIQSVLAQTYTNFELLILDNCSPDHTPEVVAEFDDARIKYLRHQCNIGGIANWIYGMHWAREISFPFSGTTIFIDPISLNRELKHSNVFPVLMPCFRAMNYVTKMEALHLNPHSIRIKIVF
jgi:glycosyltransferase involved in cell wall biosynthesis